MESHQLFELYLDKGNGALFQVEFQGKRVRCFIPQSSVFLGRKAGSAASFPELVHRYSGLLAKAALLNLERVGVSTDPWGNFVEDQDLEVAAHLGAT